MLQRGLGLIAMFVVGGAMVQAVELPPLVHTCVVEASVDDVWAAFTTSDGIKSWMVPHAEIELKVGGKMRTQYNKDGSLDDDNAIENTILSYDPKRMLSIKATKPPKTFPFKKSMENMWSVIYFESLGARQTKVAIVGLGFTDDEESLKMRKFFDAGNGYTLKKLQLHFAKR